MASTLIDNCIYISKPFKNENVNKLINILETNKNINEICLCPNFYEKDAICKLFNYLQINNTITILRLNDINFFELIPSYYDYDDDLIDSDKIIKSNENEKLINSFCKMILINKSIKDLYLNNIYDKRIVSGYVNKLRYKDIIDYDNSLVKQFFDAIKNSSITYLNIADFELESYHISDIFFDIFKYNKSIKKLFIRECNFDNIYVEKFKNTFINNDTIEELYFCVCADDGNSDCINDINPFLEIIKNNKTLKCLYLNNINFINVKNIIEENNIKVNINKDKYEAELIINTNQKIIISLSVLEND